MYYVLINQTPIVRVISNTFMEESTVISVWNKNFDFNEKNLRINI